LNKPKHQKIFEQLSRDIMGGRYRPGQKVPSEAALAIFSASYFFRQPAALRWIQAGAACLWVVYGFAIGARPVVVANVIVAAAAVYSLSSNRERSA
jgi:hypothetical protein